MIITQIKTTDSDGYQAIQVGFGEKKWSKVTRPLQGHLKPSLASQSGVKSDLAPRFLRQIRLDSTNGFNLGDTLVPSDILKPGDLVNAAGISKGRGFTGVVKRWGFSGGPRTHGQSDRQRAPGSISQGTNPGRVHRGKKMPGHSGVATVTIRNLTVVHVDDAQNEIWLKGQIPGFRNGLVTLNKVGQDKKFPGLFDLQASKPQVTTTPKAKQKTAATNPTNQSLKAPQP